jgi:hypothetical protein
MAAWTAAEVADFSARAGVAAGFVLVFCAIRELREVFFAEK